MKEAIHNFGRLGHLTGIYTAAPENDAKTALILLNAGAVHKVGPFRLNVNLAWHVSAQGVPTFRFDLSGLGESDKSDKTHAYDQMVLMDVSDAMDFLQSTYGMKTFIVLGLCTGADLAYKAAIKDERVVGLVCLDGYGYRTPRYYFNRYSKNIFRPLHLLRALAHRISRRFPTQSLENRTNDPMALVNDDQVSYYWYPPARSEYRSNMQLLCQRTNFAALLVYSGGVTDYFNYPRQMHDAFTGDNWLQQVEVVYMPETSHTYSMVADQDKLLQTVSNWVVGYFSSDKEIR